MYIYVIILFSIVIFGISNYLHLIHMHQFNHMVAFVGKEHVRLFERVYQHSHADLWAFGHRKRRSTRIQFGSDVFKTFSASGYKQMLLLRELHHVPLMYSESVVEYKLNNKTVASLWPILEEWPPPDIKYPEDWYKEMGGEMDIIHL